MTAMEKRINVLPAPTWNQLSVNAAEEGLSLPDLSAWQGLSAADEKKEPQEFRTPSPAGLPTPCFTVSALPDNTETLSQEEAERMFRNMPESGMGAYYDESVRTQKNAEVLIRVKASAKDEKPASDRNSRNAAANGDTASSGALLRTELLLTKKEACALSHHRILLEEGARLTLVEIIRSGASSVSDGDFPALAADLTEIYAEKGARLQLFQIQAAGPTARSYQAVSIHAEEGAEVEVVRATLGSAAALCGSRALLLGTGSSYRLSAIYFAAGTQRFDFNDIADHRGRNTRSDLCTAGVLAGRSDKVLRGTIDFKAGAARATGHESETVLLLGNGVRNRTVPLILCGEENVEGQHAASSGRPDAAQLYYLTSRGLTKAQAERLLIEGRFAPVLDRIPEEALRKLLSDEIGRRLTQYETETI